MSPSPNSRNKSKTVAKKTPIRLSANATNEGLQAFISTSGGKEPISDFTDKLLQISQIAKQEGAAIQHYHSTPFNKAAKVLRFHVHISQGEGDKPVLWLSRNLYKTCRPGHKYFQLHQMEMKSGKWTAAWRNTTFTVSPKFTHVEAEVINNTAEFDLWGMTSPGKRRLEKLVLTPARGN